MEIETSNKISKNSLSTSYGKIVYRCVGKKDSPLFIIVHGSGTGNSSAIYENILFEYAIRFYDIWKIFLVAIDCPGYGESTGLRSVIRAFPEKFLKEFIYKLTNKTSCLVLMGHSQGGYSIFNALLQNQKLCNFLVQDRPVCGDIKRLSSLKTPTLLIYDEEDDGHPISQGYQIKKVLKNYKFFSYKGSVNQYWVSDNLFDEILQFLFENKENFWDSKDFPNFKLIEDRIGRIFNFNQTNGKFLQSKSKIEIEINKTRNNSNTQNKLNRQRDSSSNERVRSKTLTKEKNIPLINKDNFITFLNTNKVNETNVKTKIENNLNSNSVTKLNQFILEEENEHENDEINENLNNMNIETSQIITFPDTKIESINSNLVLVKPLNFSDDDFKCPLCLEILIQPIKIPCNHIFCKACIEIGLIYNKMCPLCRTSVNSSQLETILNVKNIVKDLESLIKLKVDPQLIDNRIQSIKSNTKDKNKMVIIEYGNTSIKNDNNKSYKQSYRWTMYVKVSQSTNKNIIKNVEFNINTHMPEIKPISVNSPPYILEKTGTYEFTALIKVNFNKNVQVESYSAYHKITLNSEKTSKNFIVYLK